MLNRKWLTSFTGLLLLFSFIGCSSCSSDNEEIVDAMEMMKKIKMVRISTDAVHLPFEYGLDTGVQGFDVDIGNEIAKDLGYDARWLKVTGYNNLFETLKNGETEIVISTVVPTPELEKDFAFSKPYYDSGDGIAKRKDESDIKDLSSLAGKTVGVGEGRPGDLFMATQTRAPNVTIKKYQNLDEALGALNRTELDAVVADEPILVFSSFKSFPNLVTLPEEINTYQYAIAVRKNDQTLLASINETLDRLKASGDLATLKEKWFQDIFEQAEQKRLEYEESEALKEAPKRINVVINKKSGTFKMDRLDGFVLKLVGNGGTYQSAPILTEGNIGRCRFTTPVPPGTYSLDMTKIFGTRVNVEVPPLSKSTLSMTMNVSTQKGIDIQIK
ncbi:MAG: ABC transporter substrate-binding protein [Acidobacteriota bacterium]